MIFSGIWNKRVNRAVKYKCLVIDVNKIIEEKVLITISNVKFNQFNPFPVWPRAHFITRLQRWYLYLVNIISLFCLFNSLLIMGMIEIRGSSSKLDNSPINSEYWSIIFFPIPNMFEHVQSRLIRKSCVWIWWIFFNEHPI